MPASTETFQIAIDAAEVYEAKFVPALFGEWAPHLIDAAGVRSGHVVLDIACGTGVVAREAADRTGGEGRVVGLDLNPGMLEVARRLRPDIDWQQGDAVELPFPDDSFEVVLCQAAMMFFPDRAQAVREMARVVVPGGTVAIQTWASLEAQPGYGPFIEVAARHAGPEAIHLLGSYWVLGDLDLVRSLFEAAALEVTATHSRLGTVKFDSIDEFVKTEIEATPLVDRITEEISDAIVRDARAALRVFMTEEGQVEIPIRGHLITGRRGMSAADQERSLGD